MNSKMNILMWPACRSRLTSRRNKQRHYEEGRLVHSRSEKASYVFKNRYCRIFIGHLFGIRFNIQIRKIQYARVYAIDANLFVDITGFYRYLSLALRTELWLHSKIKTKKYNFAIFLLVSQFLTFYNQMLSIVRFAQWFHSFE